ncbi:hypothetical protein [Oceanicoccus sagamiensis]|uniref:Uncharacterized protein n=1 Tax=Oceanicoccus sagamiensis TaxID=716816 RepID=A0A1X9NB72_9GAMM|nr:hypothetical protein [Oceanicoccus sagamiensis]ARN72789.1 hypothetical protein BST96_00885 [Oceanicoccus sagamiensis]
MGNDFAGGSPWQGVIRMVAIHSRSLTQEQIIQNYDIGVGQKYFLMFSVSDLLPSEEACNGADDTDYCYIVFQVSQFDSSSYLFTEPRFVNINPEQPDAEINFDLKGIYLGLNGQLARTGQGFVNLSALISGNSFTIEGEPLQSSGSIVPLENGPENDVFFLAFEEINGNVDTAADPATDTTFTPIYRNGDFTQIGLRTFDEVNQSYSWITGVPIDSPAVSAATGKTVSETYTTVRRSLASVPDFQTFMASHQMAVMQLAAAYCDALVEDSSLSNALFNDGTAFDTSVAIESVADASWSNRFIYPLIDRAYATTLQSQPSRPDDGDDADSFKDRDDLHNVLLDLITSNIDDAASEDVPDGKADGLKFCSTSPCPAGRTAEVAKAVCTAVLSSAPAVIK